VAKKNIELLERQRVFSASELYARYHTKLEQYIKTLEIEVVTFIDMAKTIVLPAAFAYETQLLQVIKGLREVLGDGTAVREVALLREIQEQSEKLAGYTEQLNSELVRVQSIDDLSQCAKAVGDHVVSLLAEARVPADALEQLIDDSLWPLPKYSEMLFIL